MYKKIPLIFLFFVVLISPYFLYNYYFSNDQDISEIQKIAGEYFEKNENYGFQIKPGDIQNCFSQNIFTRENRVGEILSKSEVENVSCKFKIENNLVIAWSVTLIKKEKAYCGDSSGNNEITPGITLTANCKGE